MRIVYKYSVPYADDVEIEMPQGAQVLSVQLQHGKPTLWALVEDTHPTTLRCFFWRATGDPLRRHRAYAKFIGTVQDNNLVFHLFDMGEDSPKERSYE